MGTSVVFGSSSKAVPLTSGFCVHECPRRRLQRLAVELEPGAAGMDEVDLFAAVVGLVVLVDEPVACVLAAEYVQSEGPDSEVVPDRAPWHATVADFIDLADLRGRPCGHLTPPR